MTGAVFFDLDGTLLDTAPDMVAALDRLRAEESLYPMDYELARGHVSHGALGLLKIGFAHLDTDDQEALRDRFLAHYAKHLCEDTRLFPGMARVLHALDAAGTAWGVVTNKPAYLAEPLLAGLELAPRCACIVSGDTLARRKPDPDPLLHAAEITGVEPGQSVYIGDDQRDIQAGHAAGMTTVAASYGYITREDQVAAWGADFIVAGSDELLETLGNGGWLNNEAQE